MSVPGFDPSLGMLLSSRLQIHGAFASGLLDHAARLFPGGLLTSKIWAGHTASASMGLNPNQTLSTILGNSAAPGFALTATHNYSGYREDQSLFFPIQVSTEVHRNTIFSFDEVFFGNDLDLFKGATQEIGYVHNPGGIYIDLNATHTAPLWMDLAQSSLSLPTDSTPCTSLVSCGATAALTALRLLNAIDDSGHLGGLLYSDMHLAAAARLSMSV
jgi:hypothetical protein